MRAARYSDLSASTKRSRPFPIGNPCPPRAVGLIRYLDNRISKIYATPYRAGANFLVRLPVFALVVLHNVLHNGVNKS